VDPVIVFMDVGLICVHLSEPLPWGFGSVCKEGSQIVVLLCNIGLRGDKVSLPLASFKPTKLFQPLLDVPEEGCFERHGLISPYSINWNNQILLFYQASSQALVSQ
jgi:hypothetical protein